jgi:hypothetical protein
VQILPMPPQLYNLSARMATHTSIWVTGSNIAIVAGLLMLVGTHAVGKRRAMGLTLVGIALYTLLVGADAAVGGRPSWAACTSWRCTLAARPRCAPRWS